jgi:hypothetical protein
VILSQGVTMNVSKLDIDAFTADRKRSLTVISMVILIGV